MSGASKILLRYNGPGRTESPTVMIGREEPLPTMIDEGLDEVKGRRVEILSTDGVVWCVASESATQSWTEVGGGWSAMVLKELANDCWSHLAPSKGFHPGVGAACWYNGWCCCGSERRSGDAWRPVDVAVQRAWGQST
jgi:hypothetical protein